MFRRLPSGLPRDPVFPSNLKDLGYFINEEKDEIRSIENPKAYFKFFLSKNERFNIVQREAMNEIIRNLVRDRLSDLSLTTLRLPLGASATQPHVPIYTTPNLSSCTRLIILFAESTQDIGIFAHRIIGGPGGINTGSAVNLVDYILSSATSNANEDVGIILANTGQLRWCRKLRKAVTQTSWWALPSNSAVDHPYRFDEVKNTIPENRNVREHVHYVFETVVSQLVNPTAKISIIGVSEGAFQVSKFLDNESNWYKWGSGRIQAFVAISTYWQENDFVNPSFKAWFEKQGGRVYLPSDKKSGDVICGPCGGRKVAAYGTNAFAVGEEYYSECMLPKGYKVIVDWLGEVAKRDASGGYMNEVLEVVESESEGEEVFAQNEDGKPGWESE